MGHSSGVPQLHQVNNSPVAASGAGAHASLTPSLAGGAANAPCSTLFVANLGQFVSEQELKDLFSRYDNIRHLMRAIIYGRHCVCVCVCRYHLLRVSIDVCV